MQAMSKQQLAVNPDFNAHYYSRALRDLPEYKQTS